MVVIAAPPS